MSAAASGSENWMWMAFLRMAEPLMQKVAMAAADGPEPDRMLGLAAEPVGFCAIEEDAERWDGLS